MMLDHLRQPCFLWRGDYDRLLPHTVQNTASDSLTGAPQCGQYLLVRCGWAGSSGSRENTTGFPGGAGCVTGSAGSDCAGRVGGTGEDGCGALAVLLHITYYSSGVIYNGRNTMLSSSLKSPVCKT